MRGGGEREGGEGEEEWMREGGEREGEGEWMREGGERKGGREGGKERGKEREGGEREREMGAVIYKTANSCTRHKILL